MDIQNLGASCSLSLFFNKNQKAAQGSVTPDLSTGLDKDTARVFADEIVRRIEQPYLDGVAADEGTAPRSVDKLRDSLAEAIEFIKSNFGGKAATAAMAGIFNAVGQNALTEENLGQGLIQAIRLIDLNFGFSAGDRLIGWLNNNLNVEMNDYFNNGLEEEFFAVENGQISRISIKADDLAGWEAASADGMMKTILDVLKDKDFLEQLKEMNSPDKIAEQIAAYGQMDQSFREVSLDLAV